MWGGIIGGDNLWNPQGIWVGGREAVAGIQLQYPKETGGLCLGEQRDPITVLCFCFCCCFVLFFDKEKKLLVE